MVMTSSLEMELSSSLNIPDLKIGKYLRGKSGNNICQAVERCKYQRLSGPGYRPSLGFRGRGVWEEDGRLQDLCFLQAFRGRLWRHILL